jgi:hypothetical protein
MACLAAIRKDMAGGNDRPAQYGAIVAAAVPPPSRYIDW